MTNRELLSKKVFIIEDRESSSSHSMHQAVERLAAALRDREIDCITSGNLCDARNVALNDMDIDCFLIATNMECDKNGEIIEMKLIDCIRNRQALTPVFLLADRARTSESLSEKMMERADEFVWIFEDSPVFIAGRIESAITRFRKKLLPPLMKAIWEYNESNHEYSWAAPGHQGGVGFTKSPEGKKFYDFYGENLFRTDTGIERSSIGSLLDHEGAFGKSEEYASKVFGSHRSWSVLCGTSGSNRAVMQAVLQDGDVAVCDRNCHKSIEQGLILTGAVPVYMVPTRNRYGIIGPVRPCEMTKEAIAKKMAMSPLLQDGKQHKSVYAVVTNCTYDGLCYNAKKVEELLDQSVNHIHEDEAWYAYARFHPIYEEHFAMRGCPSGHKGATVYATHSTHKLLNALSQASYIHERHGRGAVSFDRFNQAYMMQATTSPLYAIAASNDISCAMMDRSGKSLLSEVIAEAVDFRQACARINRDLKKNGGWFFTPWNADKVTDPETKQSYCFCNAPRELLCTRQNCWRIEDGDTWHGFKDIGEENWVMLDPIKVSILTPGMGENGLLESSGVPAALVSAYLYQQGIVPTRTTDFQIMFLFSMGVTKGKWGTLLNTLLNFKRHYDANTPVADVLPGLIAGENSPYQNEGLHDLGDRMFEFLRRENPENVLDTAFSRLPEQVMTPRDAYRKIVAGQVEFVPTDRLSGRIAANAVIPYPPGIPMVMSGERFGREGTSPQTGYLFALEAWGREFPGFEHVTEGARYVNGQYQVMCVME